MAHKGYREASRIDWGTSNPDPAMTLEQINTGALLRIADATEKMAKNHADLVRERDNYKRWYAEEMHSKEQAQRHASSLRGVITKLKKRLAQKSEAA